MQFVTPAQKARSLVCLFVLLQIFWSDSGELVCIATEESFFILKYLSEKVLAAQETHEGVTEDGIEDAFEVIASARLCFKCFMSLQQTVPVLSLHYKLGFGKNSK